MTEQMAIGIVRKEKAYMDSHAGRAQSEAFEMAIKALEEVQQYRALGMTPELIEAMQGHNIAMINDLAEYQALGTVEEILKELSIQGDIIATQHETLKEYRNLGTVEELRVAKGVYDKMYNTAKEMFKDDENRQREFREKLSKSFSRK